MSEHTADYSKHTDEELEQAIRKSEEEDTRVAAEDSKEALEAERRQRDQMLEELRRRRQ